MKAQFAARLPFPIRIHLHEPAAPPSIFACVAAPPDRAETAGAALLAGVALLWSAAVVTLVACVVSG